MLIIPVKPTTTPCFKEFSSPNVSGAKVEKPYFKPNSFIKFFLIVPFYKVVADFK